MFSQVIGWVASAAATQIVTARDSSTADLPTNLSPPSTIVTPATNASSNQTSKPNAPEQYATPGGAIKDEPEREERDGDDACAAANAVAAANFLSDMNAPTQEVSSTRVSKFRQERF